jgi:hypothetical protein
MDHAIMVDITTNPPQTKHHQESPGSEQSTPQKTREELQEAIKGSNQILATAGTVMPVFADTITVDRAKFTVTKRSFFRTADVISMRIEDILNVTEHLGMMFGSIKITSRVMNANPPYAVGPFWRKDAVRIKRITQGYVIALQRGIDCSSLPSAELAKMLEELGEDSHHGAAA